MVEEKMRKAQCRHLNFHSLVKVNRILENDDDEYAQHFSADLSVTCTDCGEKFVFMGLKMGHNPVQPMISADRLEARLPIVPQTEFKLLSQPIKGES